MNSPEYSAIMENPNPSLWFAWPRQDATYLPTNASLVRWQQEILRLRRRSNYLTLCLYLSWKILACVLQNIGLCHLHPRCSK